MESISTDVQLILGAALIVVSLFALILSQPKCPTAQVTRLFIHPIKSCAATEVQQAEFNARGFVGDRRYMLVKADTMRFISMRQQPRMALIKPHLTKTGLRVEAPGADDLIHACLDETAGSLVDVGIWNDSVKNAVDQGDAAADWFSAFLGLPLRLVYMPESCVRAVDPRFKLSSFRSANITSFADGFPFLLASEQSIECLSERVGKDMSMSRFRPNIVVSGDNPAHDEERWSEVKVGSEILYGRKRCTRCVMTTVNPVTGEKPAEGIEAEPLKTLRTYRSSDGGASATFGNNMLPHWSRRRTKNGIIKVGDKVVVNNVATLAWK